MANDKKSDEKSEDKKVVPFPTHKIKKPKIGVKPTFGQPDGQNRRMTLFLSLISTLLVATYMASRLNLNQGPATSGDRNIASIGGTERRDLDDDIMLAKKIARDSLREPASRGREPTAEDILQHGELGSVYHLDFNDLGALTGLDYQGEPGREHYLRGRSEFLQKYKDLIRIEFDTITLSESIQDKEKSRKFEVYELKQGEKVKARVHYTLDDQDRFYSMNVESL